MFKTLRSLLTDESGATAIEYGLIAGLVSVAAIFALTQLGASLTTIFGVVSGELDTAAASASGAAAP
jgi:pilus assembly protein Flp/PilA